eukprot:2806646-Rhodomonas_salina.1
MYPVVELVNPLVLKCQNGAVFRIYNRVYYTRRRRNTRCPGTPWYPETTTSTRLFPALRKPRMHTRPGVPGMHTLKKSENLRTTAGIPWPAA